MILLPQPLECWITGLHYNTCKTLFLNANSLETDIVTSIFWIRKQKWRDQKEQHSNSDTRLKPLRSFCHSPVLQYEKQVSGKYFSTKLLKTFWAE
jgi:hypothetical protein